MSLLRFDVQVVIPMDSGLPEDVVVNTFAFGGHDPAVSSSVDMDNIVNHLTSFYSNIDQHLGSDTNIGATFLKIYDRDAPAPRTPLRTVTIGAALTSSGTTSGPHEVALCLSFKTATVSGQNRARNRGRIFIGPLASSLMAPAPSTTLINDVVAAANVLVGQTDADLSWDVYSPADDESKVIAEG